MLREISLLAAILIGSGASAHAQVADGYFQIGQTEVSEIKDSGFPQMMGVTLESPTTNLGECAKPPKNTLMGEDLLEDLTGISLDQVINIGAKVWKLVEANKPEVNAKYVSASAMPAGLTCWNELETWSAPEAKSYQVSMKNLLGIEVVNFTFRVIYSHHGSKDGVGQYLTGVKVLPNNLSVLWGYKFDANVSIANVYNAGTKTQPVGAMEVLVDWTVTTPLKYQQQTYSYYVNGAGDFKSLQ